MPSAPNMPDAVWRIRGSPNSVWESSNGLSFTGNEFLSPLVTVFETEAPWRRSRGRKFGISLTRLLV